MRQENYFDASQLYEILALRIFINQIGSDTYLDQKLCYVSLNQPPLGSDQNTRI